MPQYYYHPLPAVVGRGPGKGTLPTGRLQLYLMLSDTAPKVPVPMRVDAMLVLFVTRIRSMVKDVPNRGMNPVNAKRVTFVLLAVIQPSNGSAKRVIIVHEVQPRRSNVPTMPKNVLVNIVWLGSPCRKTFLMDFVVSINRTVEVLCVTVAVAVAPW